MARVNQFNFSSFYCPVCGKEAMVLPRPRSLTRRAFHRKKLYCFWCEETHNCVECRNELERCKFLEDWKKGKYVE